MYVRFCVWAGACVLCGTDVVEARVTMKFAQKELSLGFPRPSAPHELYEVKNLAFRHSF